MTHETSAGERLDDSRSPARRAVCALGVIVVTIGVPGCSDPFRSELDDYGLRLPEEALRSIDPLDLERDAVHDDQEKYDPTERRANPLAEAAEIVLSIEECRARTLENNLDLRVALIDPEIAATFESEEEGAFEATFLAAMQGSDADPGQLEVYRDEFVRPFELEPSVVVPLRTGGLLEFSSPAFHDIDIPEESYTANLDVSIALPLLRGAGRRATTHRVRIAALDSQIAQLRTKLEVIRQIADVDRAYWLLWGSVKTLEVRQQQWENARAQLDKVDARFHGKVAPKIELTRARAGLSRRLSSIIDAELAVRDAQRTLKRIVNMPGADVDSAVRLRLSSEPDPVRYELDGPALVGAALDTRVELLELELQLAQDFSTIDFAENQRLPLFTMDYAYRLNGTGKSFGRAYEGAFGADAWGWKLGAVLEVPLGNEAAEARVHRAILSRLQRLATRSAREQAVKQEVLAALDNLDLTWQQIMAAVQSSELERANYEGELGQYELGQRNSTEVLDAEARLSDALVTEIDSIVDYQISQVDLGFATGTLLGASQVSW